MSTASGIPGGGPDKGEVHAETPQPIDLAHGHGHTLAHPLHATHVLRASSPGGPTSVVQIRPMRAILTPGATLVGGKGSTVGLPTVVTATHPSILVNRGGPLTLFPRGAQMSGVTSSNLSTLQFTRGTLLSNVRPSLSPGQPTSITMAPLPTSNYGTSIRISSPVNNGSWIQTTGTPGTTYTSVRPIQVTSRPVRPDGGKIIHIPQSGGVQHLTQLQVVDNKGSIIKPTTPISVRGTLQQSSTGIALGPLAPFTIRATPLQRPPASVITTASQAQKVITQPAHGPPIIVNTNQKFTQIQNFSALQRTPVISIAANGGTSVITASNPSLVSMSPRQTSSIIMSSSGGSPTKAYPISSRDISTTLVETYINQGHVQPQQNHINSPTLTVVPNVSNVNYSPPSAIRPTFVITSSSNSASLKGITPSSPSHQIVQVQAASMNPGSLNLPNYYIDPKNLATNVSIYPSLSHGKRISIHETSSLEKRNEKGGLVTSGQMILTSSGQVSDGGGGGGGLAAHFSHPVPLQTPLSNQVTAHPLSLPKGSPLSIPHSQISIHPHSTPTNVITPAIITTSVTTTTSSANSLTTTNTSIVTLSLNASGGGGNGGAAISTITTTSTTISSPVSSTSATAPPPSQSKATLSPRPSILRKREAGACETNFVPLRAQRNLSVNFTSGPVGQGNNGPAPATSSPSVLISTVSSNKENNSTNLGGVFPNSLGSFGLNSVTPSSSSTGSLGVSILKKEFQPPNEESSWQSSSSNSSSGSTTISATSETAELPGTDVGFVAYHQPLLPTPPVSIGHHNPTNLSGIVISRAQPQQTSFPLINVNPVQNGVLVRARAPPPSGFSCPPSSVAIVSGPHPTPPRHRATFAKGREPKGRGTRDVVSPRKKPRKQQLTSSDFIESSSPEISFYQAKRFKRGNEPGVVGKTDKPTDQPVVPPLAAAPPPQPPEPQEERIRYSLKKPHVSLFETNKFVPNLLHNHFKRYSDVKSKDERRPTISDLANQKNVFVKISGWKLKHLTTQIDRVIDSEVDVVQQFNSLLSELNSEDFVASASSSRDLSRIEDLLKGNLQRCKVVKDQLTESKSQVSKVLEHHPRILDVISKHISKRPAKKREKV